MRQKELLRKPADAQPTADNLERSQMSELLTIVFVCVKAKEHKDQSNYWTLYNLKFWQNILG